MYNRTKIFHICSLKALLPFAMLLAFSVPLFSSNLSEARGLREKCEGEISKLKIVVSNFGDKDDKSEFAKAAKLVRIGKLKFIQSKYPEAIKRYNNYLKIQNDLYRSLARKYIKRTAEINDTVAEDVVDNIDNKKVEHYLRLANQNLQDAKSNFNTKHYKNSIIFSRRAKSYALGAYKLIKKKIPKIYIKDNADNNEQIHKK